MAKRQFNPRVCGYHANLSHQQVEKMAQLYAQGISIALLGERFNVSISTVWKKLKQPKEHKAA